MTTFERFEKTKITNILDSKASVRGNIGSNKAICNITGWMENYILGEINAADVINSSNALSSSRDASKSLEPESDSDTDTAVDDLETLSKSTIFKRKLSASSVAPTAQLER